MKMSEITQSLPTLRETADRQLESTNDSEVESASNIQQLQENIEIQTSFNSFQSLDESVFVTLSGQKQNITNDDRNNDTTAPSVGTVEVTVHHSLENYVNIEHRESKCSHILTETYANESKSSEIVTVSNYQSTNQLICMSETDSAKAKHRKKVNHVPADDVVFSDVIEKNLYIQIANSNKIPITCKRNHAILHKEKLGSGKKGKCINFENEWHTPSEFENLCGLEMSKDWKRSLRYGGRSMQNLINEGYLRPHAATCTCANCSNDKNVTGPVRYFTPKSRRKRSAASSLSDTSFLLSHDGNRPSTAPPVQQMAQQFCLQTPKIPLVRGKNSYFTLPPTLAAIVGSPNVVVDCEAKNLLQTLAKNEQEDRKLWAKLDKKAENMAEKFKLLQDMIQNAKHECEERKNDLLDKITTILGNQKNRNMSSAESSIQAAQRFTGGYSEKLIEDEEDAEICRACGRHAISECTGCRKATYCSTECQEKDWNAGHRDVCRGLPAHSQSCVNSQDISL